MTDPLTHISTQDIISAAIKDHDTHAAIMRLPTLKDRIEAEHYLDGKQRAQAKRMAIKSFREAV